MSVMNVSDLGYDRDLFVLPFDHRGSFEEGLLGISGRRPATGEMQLLRSYKQMVYEGLLQALDRGVPLATAALLVDQTYGESILADAKERGIITCVPVEKSGQAEFDFEYGDQFRQRLDAAAPAFAKVLVRYNPDGDQGVNRNQRRRLKLLSDYTHSAGYKFMFELLVPATPAQLDAVGRDARAYDRSVRPALTVRAMAEIQAEGIEPDVWKLEGTEDPQAARAMVAQARAGGRDGVGLIVLGRAESEERVGAWLGVGARTEGYIGFAVGRTIFWQPLVDYQESAIPRDAAVTRIAEGYQRFYRLFTGTREQSG